MSISIRTLKKDNYVYNTLRLKLEDSVTVKTAVNNKSVFLSNPKIIQHSGKSVDGEEVTKLGQGRIYELSFGTICPDKDIVLVSVNPALSLSCVVSNPGVINAKSLQNLSIPIYTVKQTDISELDWIVALYVLA